MKPKSIITLLLLVAGTCSFAQTTESTYRHDIGFNTNIILEGIFNGGGAPFALMYKVYPTDNKAWRFGIASSMSLNTVSTDAPINTNSNNFYNVYLTIGKEKQLRITDKWMWYFGGDIVPGLNSNHLNSYNTGILTETDISTTYSVALRPFIGVRFNISPRLYLSTEFSINALYNNAKSSNEIFNPTYNYQEVKRTSFQLNFNPASAIFFYYRF